MADEPGHMHFRRMDEGTDADFAILARVHQENIRKLPDLLIRLLTRQLRNVPGRKSDVLDCQWIQQLHTFGLLAAAFRTEDQICVLRSYLRQRAMLVTYAAHHIQHMQKALEQMNVTLARVVSDVTG
jgi:hypothetical protein